jgi:hypothetical protein
VDRSSPRRVSALRTLLVAALACATLPAALAPTSSNAAAPLGKDPHTIACPAASTRWFVPASSGGKEIEDGETDLHYRPSDAVTVNCNYFTRDGMHVLVSVQYALPSDPNPINDFYYGCSSSETAWNSTDRVFRLTSRDQWAVAVFYDTLLQLKDGEVGMFEAVTRRLLQNAEGYAHDCSLRVAPTAVGSTYAFTFDVPAGKAEGSFVVRADPNRDPRASTAPVVQARAPTIRLSVTSGGTTHPLAIEISHGVTYRDRHFAKPATSSVTFAIRVVGSKVPSCRKGASGTLTVSTAPSVSLRVCGQTFLHGRAKASISLLR